MERYLPTGNEMISLPKLNADTSAIEDLTFLSMQQRGMIELCGTEDEPLMQPFLTIDGAELPMQDLSWSRVHFWIPVGQKETQSASVKLTVLTPVGERGFAVRIAAMPKTDCRVTFGLRGLWAKSLHCVNEEKELEGHTHAYASRWGGGLVIDYRVGFPTFALAPMTDRAGKSEWAQTEDGISYQISCELDAKAGQEEAFTIFWGLGFEEVAAATSAKEQLRRGWDWLYRKTADWLDKRIMQLPTPELTEVYNVNQFFCLFYATGRTFDTEELICATSRSTRYYVSAAYWDRDSLLWAFPTILRADAALAKEVLTYVFTRQRQNIGVHSRFIDGTMLEPGFELDELVAPVLALQAYRSETRDEAFLQERFVQDGLSLILTRLQEVRHPETALYETFLQPTDDEIVYPYLTYDNVLVWRALQLLADWRPAQRGSLLAEADAVRAAIFTHCVKKDADGQPYFAWSVDLAGHHDVYDEPPGSLQLLPYYGFCERTDVIWQNTVRMIRSADYKFSFAGKPIAEIGCPHAPWPWVLSLCNSLLCGHAEQALRELTIMPMDNGIACESVDADTGECTTGSAFATCAGFLCHALLTACMEAQRRQD